MLPPPDISAVYVDEKNRPSREFYNWIRSLYISVGNLLSSNNTWTGTNTFDSANPIVIGVDTPQGGPLINSKLLISDGNDTSDNTVLISRTDFGGPSANTFALRGIGVADGTSTSQLNVVAGSALGFNNQDTVAVFGTAQKLAGTGVAYGGFFQSFSFLAGSGAYAVQTDVQNETGVAYPYTQINFGNKFVGIDLVYNTTTAAVDSGCAIQFRQAGGSAWDVGLGFQGTAVKTSLIDNDTDCVKLWNDTGAHITGLDFSGATFSGSQIRLAMGASLTNAANDAAAAGAGVPVGGIYRNGSVLMVRVV